MEDGGWRMEDGGWRMEDGGWRMEDGGWRMEDGGWRMEDGGWRMEDGGWRMGDGGWSRVHWTFSIHLFDLFDLFAPFDHHGTPCPRFVLPRSHMPDRAIREITPTSG